MQHIYCTPELNKEVFDILEKKLLSGINNRTSRPGMTLWEILVFAVVRLTLDTNYDRLEHIANYDILVRSLLGISTLGDNLKQYPYHYHVYKDGSYYYVQYWYFLGMNDIREQLPGIGDNWHEGDWEHVSIRISKQGNSYIPAQVNFYIHEGGRTFNAFECWWSASNSSTYNGIHQGFVDNQYTHLNIWIAANAHASYNRYSTVYERIVLGIDYHDRVDYSPNGNDLYFEYDTLIKLGEVVKLTYT